MIQSIYTGLNGNHTCMNIDANGTWYHIMYFLTSHISLKLSIYARSLSITTPNANYKAEVAEVLTRIYPNNH